MVGCLMPAMTPMAVQRRLDIFVSVLLCFQSAGKSTSVLTQVEAGGRSKGLYLYLCENAELCLRNAGCDDA
jgi:hypothetical protein